MGGPQNPTQSQLDPSEPGPGVLSIFLGPVPGDAGWGGKDAGWGRKDRWMQAGVGRMQGSAQGSLSPHLSILPPAIPLEGFKGKLI